MDLVWARSRHWELDNPHPGEVLHEAIRISGKIDGPAATDGISRQATAAGASPDYRITGPVVSAQDFQADMGNGPRHAGTDVVLFVDGERVLAQVPGPAATLALGARVTVCGEVSLVPAYEWDAFELADTRRAWLIEDVRNPDAGEYMILLRRTR